MQSIEVPSRMVRRFWLGLVAFALPAAAQLFPVGTPLPKSLLPPVVFINGYQQKPCSSSTTFQDTFGNFDQFLQASSGNRVSVFFDNCSITGNPPIETLAANLATFIGSLKYSDGTAVTQVDVVAHSMGGLIVRAYLAGMQLDGTFKPPANPSIRKAVLLSSPNFGTYAAALLGTDSQTAELQLGSPFNYALATWNQGTDDMRGIDALAVSGNGGAIPVNGQIDGDGVASLTSSSIGFALPGRTRIIPYCHISYADLVVLLQPVSLLFSASSVCPVGAPGIAKGVNATDTNVLLVQSFLNGTPDWQTIGQSPEQNPLASVASGAIVRAKSANDNYLSIQDAIAGKTSLTLSGGIVAYNEFVSSGTNPVIADIVSNPPIQSTATLTPGTTSAILLKAGPQIAAVIPAAALVTPRAVAPGTFVSIYGSALANTTALASTTPFPTVLGGTQVLVNGTAIPIQYVSPTQINAVFPTLISGLVTVSVMATAGQHTVNVLTQNAVPAIFTADGTTASAINAVTGTVVGPATPLHAGDYVSLYLTGLGVTAAGADGLQHSSVIPTVTVAGQTCALQFAGLSPQFQGVDQINCQIPAGLGVLSAAPVIVTANGRASNTAALALQ